MRQFLSAYVGGHYVRIVVIAFALIITAGAGLGILADLPTEKPDRQVRVDSFEPQGETEPQTNITITFSNDLVPSDSIDRPVTDMPVVFEPTIPALARWVATDAIRIFPDEPLNPATAYKAKIKSNRDWVRGNRIKDDAEFEFHTPKLTLEDWTAWSQRDEEQTTAGTFYIEVYFNYEVRTADLRKRLNIEGEGEASVKNPGYKIAPMGVSLDGFVQEQYDTVYASSFTIRTDPIPLTRFRQAYRATISKSLDCRNCGDVLDREYSYKLEMPSQPSMALKIRDVTVRGKSIDVNLSHKVLPSEAAEYVSVEPKVDKLSVGGNYRGLILDGEFQPGTTYEIKFASGMHAVDGSRLDRNFSSKVVIPDLRPSVKFSDAGLYLPRHGNRLLQIETVNVDTLSIEVQQIYPNNLVYYLAGNRRNYYGFDLSLYGRQLWIKDFALDGEKNKTLTSTVDLSDIIGQKESGIFRVSARYSRERWTQDTRQAMLTDIGIVTRKTDDQLTVWLNTLDEVKPIEGARVALYSRNNQVLKEAVSDADGVVSLDSLSQFDKEATPYAVVVENGDDLAYLLFSDCLVDQSDFDVQGRPYLTKGYEAFLYSDRGVYRPGETAHLVSIVRGVGCSVPADFPYKLEVSDPRGKIVQTYLMNDAGASMASVDFAVDEAAMTGNYVVTATVGEDEHIGRAGFQVEEFMPDRIKTVIEPVADEFNAGDTLRFSVTGTFLFGPPAAGHKVSATLRLDPQDFQPDGFSRYTFKDNDVSFKSDVITLGDAKLDDSGKYIYEHRISSGITAPSSLKGTIWGQVFEQGGRGVANYATITINPYPVYMGLHLNLDGYAKPNDSVTADVIAYRPGSGQVAAKDVTVKYYKVEYNSMYRRDQGGRGRWVSQRTLQLLDSSRIDLTAEGAQIGMVPQRWGRYRMTVEDTRGGHRAAVEYFAWGWGYSPWSMEQPDRIQFDLDREMYVPGDTANLQVRAPFSGKLLLTIERDKVVHYETIELPENTAAIPLLVKKEWFPNVYITGTLIKTAAEIESKTPARAFGTIALRLDPKLKLLPVKIEAPEVMEPREKISIKVETPGQPNSTLMLAAVDEGILQLTGYKTPDPLDFFHGKKRARVEAYDIYSFVYPVASEESNRLSPAGGAKADLFESQRKRQLNPFSAKRVKPVALWSGRVTTDSLGKATVDLDVPQFNGQLTIMAVAARKDLFGAANTATKVRDKIVVQESFPRFISPNDMVEAMITVYNNLGKEAPITLDLTLDGPAQIVGENSQTLTVKDGGEGVFRFKLKADLKPGVVKVKIAASGEGESTGTEFELPNRPAQPLTTVFSSGTVNDSTPASIMFAGSWVEGTDQYVIKTSSLAAVAFTRNIEFLLRYPYGCVEQTTSRLFPLLYFNDLAKFVQPELFGGHGHEYFINEGIERLLRMQRPDRAFNYWPSLNSHYHNWSSIYAAHFLVEAKAAGYEVEESAYKNVLKFLEDMARGKRYDKISDAHRIYAAYALARAGKTDKKVTNFLKDLDKDKLPAYSRWQIAGALGMAGEVDMALAMLPGEIQPDLSDPEDGGNFSSGVRTDAILLDVLLQLAPDHTGIPVLAKSLMEQARIGRWYTTQSTAFALMALGKYLKDHGVPDFQGTLTIGADETIPFDTSSLQLIRNDLAGKRVTISIDGSGDCYYYWNVSGVSTSPTTPEYERGIRVLREYFDADGNPLDMQNVELGSQVVAKISVTALNKSLSNVVVNDLLPAGLEIENPRLNSAPDLAWIPKAQDSFTYRDIRDDRLLLFMDLWELKPKTFYYSLRAVSAGEFKVPAISAECMYNPLIAGASSSNVLTVKGGRE